MPKGQLYKDENGKWRYRVIAGGQIADASHQGWRSKWYAKKRLKRAWPGLRSTDIQTVKK